MSSTYKRAWGVFFAFTLSAVAAPRFVDAQDDYGDEPDDVDRLTTHDDPRNDDAARDLFIAGRKAMEAQDFAGAVQSFRKSLELAPRSSTAFNLTVGHRSLGQFAEAHRLLKRLEGGAFGSVPASKNDELRAALRDTRARIHHFVLNAAGAYGQWKVTVNGRSMQTSSGNNAVDVYTNPGPVLFQIRDERNLVREFKVDAVAGGRSPLTAAFRAGPTKQDGDGQIISEETDSDPFAADEISDSASDNVLETWWFWSIVGVVVVGATAGTIIAVGSDDSDADFVF